MGLKELSKEHQSLATQGEESFRPDLGVMHFVDCDLSDIWVFVDEGYELAFDTRLLEGFIILD
jgi:hypothetical protein